MKLRLAVLSKSPLFRGLPADALEKLAERSVSRRIDRGQVLFTAGDPSDGFYIVLSGAVRAFRVSLSGREQTIHVERTGGALAEVAVFDGDPYPSTAVAEEDSEVLFIAKDQMRKLMLQYPETALNALAYVAGKLRMVAAMMEQIALMDVGQRLAKLLLDEVNACAPDKAAGAVSFPLSLSHAQIAARLGSVREVITRALHKLAQQRIIEMRGRRIVVLDLNGLRRRAERHVSGSIRPYKNISERGKARLRPF